MSRSGDSDRGSASIWLLTGAILVLTVAFVGMARAGAVVARHRAETAADLSALAAAGGIGIDPSTAESCRRAERIAAANAARVTACQVSLDSSGRAGTVAVRVEVAVRLAGFGLQRVAATARAERAPG